MFQRSILIALVLAALPLAGASAQEARTTQLILQESAERMVEQNVLTAVLTARAGAESARDAQAAVNRSMAAATEEAGEVAAVRAATGGYRVHREHGRDGEPIGWIAEQDLRLTSEEPAPLLELAGRLQEAGLHLNGLTWSLDDATRRTVRDELTIEAIGALRERAAAIAESVGMRVLNIATLRIGAARAEPRPMLAMRAEAADMTPPTALPDLETVSASVEAEITLAPE